MKHRFTLTFKAGRMELYALDIGDEKASSWAEWLSVSTQREVLHEKQSSIGLYNRVAVWKEGLKT